LSAGVQVLRIVCDTGGNQFDLYTKHYIGNFNYLDLIAGPSPAVSVTSPAPGASFTAPANITVNATASESGRTITKVDFYAGTSLIGTATSAPYSINWSNVAIGSYTLTAKATDDAGATTTSLGVIIAVNRAGTGSTPFGGTAWVIPGRVEAENFDTGGEGVAYHDLDAGNNGGQYRLSEGVDIEVTTDTGGGYDVSSVQAGEWLQYTVNVQPQNLYSTYTFAVQVASSGNGGTFHIEVNGIDKTGPMTIPNTGGGQQWQTVQTTGVSLSPGMQVVRVVFDANGAGGFVGKINYIDVIYPLPFGGTPLALPGRIEAENFDTGGQYVGYFDLDAGNNGGQYRVNDWVDIEGTTDTGGGYDVGWIQATEYLHYLVNVQSTGTYTIAVRVASSGAGGTFHIEFQNVDKTGTLTIPNTGGWQQWQTLTRSGVSLSAGLQDVKVVFDTNGTTGFVGNLNYIEISP
jgi:hypothetical protein